jgi:hypothetical protein
MSAAEMCEAADEERPKTAKDLILEEQLRCSQLCRNYLHNSAVNSQKSLFFPGFDFSTRSSGCVFSQARDSVDKAKLQMRELWNKRAPAGKGKKSKSKKK